MRPPLLTEEPDLLPRLLAARGLREVPGPRRNGLVRAADERGSPWAVALVPRLTAADVARLSREAGNRRLLVAVRGPVPIGALAQARKHGVDVLDGGALATLPATAETAARREAFSRDAAARGQALLDAGDLPAALAELRRATEANPADLAPRFALAETLHRLGRSREEVLEYEALRRLGLYSPRIAINHGAALHALGRHAEAVTVYDGILRRLPENARAWNNKGAALLAMRRPEEAAECLERALHFAPEMAEARQNLTLAGGKVPPATEPPTASPAEGAALASLLRSLDLPADATRAWETTAATDEPSAWLGMSLALRGIREEDVADRALDRAAAGKEPAARIAKSLQLQEEKRYSEADQVLEGLSGFRAEVRRASIAHARGDPEAALAHTRAAAEAQPSSDLAWNALGAAELRRGNFHSALSSMDRAVEAAPDNAAAVNNRGVALFRLGRYAAARESFERAVDLDPHEAGYRVNLGLARDRTRSSKAAERALRTAIDVDPAWGTPYAELARLRQARGDRRGARRLLAKAVALGWRKPT